MKATSLLHPLKEKNPGSCKHSKEISKYKSFHQGLNPDSIEEISIESPKTMVELGTLDRLDYTKKEVDGEEHSYYHKFGEEDGQKPVLATDKEGKSIYIIGGNYRIDDWIYN